MYNIKKSVALDMSLNGRMFIVTEFVIGVFLPLILIGWFLFSPLPEKIWQYGILFWLLGNSFNYLPLLWYAIYFAKNQNYKEYSADVASGESIKEHTLKQILIFIPFYFFFLTLFQSQMEKQL